MLTVRFRIRDVGPDVGFTYFFSFYSGMVANAVLEDVSVLIEITVYYRLVK
jgi:hypothetical protein